MCARTCECVRACVHVHARVSNCISQFESLCFYVFGSVRERNGESCIILYLSVSSLLCGCLCARETNEGVGDIVRQYG